MSSCDVMQAAVVDEALPRPDGLEAHLASCVGCGAFARAHRSALQLERVSPVVARRRNLAEVQKRAGLLVSLVLVIGGTSGLLFRTGLSEPVEDRQLTAAEDDLSSTGSDRTEEDDLSSTGSDRPEGALEIADGRPAPELLALAELNSTIHAELSRDLRDDATAIAVFGALPAWVAPRRTQPMKSLGRAASPLTWTTEDSP